MHSGLYSTTATFDIFYNLAVEIEPSCHLMYLVRNPYITIAIYSDISFILSRQSFSDMFSVVFRQNFRKFFQASEFPFSLINIARIRGSYSDWSGSVGVVWPELWHLALGAPFLAVSGWKPLSQTMSLLISSKSYGYKAISHLKNHVDHLIHLINEEMYYFFQQLDCNFQLCALTYFS